MEREAPKLFHQEPPASLEIILFLPQGKRVKFTIKEPPNMQFSKVLDVVPHFKNLKVF